MDIKKILLKKYAAPILVALMFSSSPALADELKDISTLAEKGQQAAALKRINTYLQANPKDAQGMFMKGIILAESGKRTEAIKTFDALTKAYPNLPEPYNNLAVLHAEAGEYDAARKSLQKAIKTHPSYATAHENLGDIYARMASQAYDKALKIDTSNARAQDKLSLIKDLFSTTGRETVVAANTTPTRPIRPANQKAAPAPKPAPATKPVVAAVPAPTPAAVETKPIARQPATPAPTPAPAPVPAANLEGDIAAAAAAWSDAWASQNVERYLASYADSFSPSNGKSRSSWEKLRRTRVSAPAGITHTMKNQKIEVIDDNNAKVRFSQYYKAKGRNAIRTNKTLILKKVNGAWLINKEIASN